MKKSFKQVKKLIDKKTQITLQTENCNHINIYKELKKQSKIYSIVYIIDIKAL